MPLLWANTVQPMEHTYWQIILWLSINSPYISSTCDNNKCIDVNMKNCTKQYARRGQTEKD